MTVALLTPLTIVVALAAFQAALWSHARTEARVVARDTAALIARGGVATGDARAAAVATLTTDTDLRGVAVDVAWVDGIVTVTVRGDAPGILLGTAAGVDVSESVADEDAPR